MFVITADQVDSRGRADIVAPTLEALNARFADRLALPPDRNAGDELQVLTADAAAALDLILGLTREGAWSVGLGIGRVRLPLPENTREATGDAFVAGLLYGLAAGQDLTPVIALAQRCGALATTAKGAMTALPWQHEL